MHENERTWMWLCAFYWKINWIFCFNDFHDSQFSSVENVTTEIEKGNALRRVINELLHTEQQRNTAEDWESFSIFRVLISWFVAVYALEWAATSGLLL